MLWILFLLFEKQKEISRWDVWIISIFNRWITRKNKKKLEEAESKGIAEGEKIGMENAFLETAKRMLKDGFSIEKIMQMTNLSLADIKAISL